MDIWWRHAWPIYLIASMGLMTGFPIIMAYNEGSGAIGFGLAIPEIDS